jgi:hypothetical protein
MAAALTLERSTYWKAEGSLCMKRWKDLLVAASARREERGRYAAVCMRTREVDKRSARVVDMLAGGCGEMTPSTVRSSMIRAGGRMAAGLIPTDPSMVSRKATVRIDYKAGDI